jgi:uncharacterized SAM-binding protein YcdF (DUF218 family)
MMRMHRSRLLPSVDSGGNSAPGPCRPRAVIPYNIVPMKPSPTPAQAVQRDLMPALPERRPVPARLARGAADRFRRLKTMLVLLVSAGLLSSGLFFGGFLVFATTVSRMSAPDPLEADGIVVLTGGADRVSGAVDLLSGGHARRLLISGVHPETSARQIGKVVDAGPSLFDCCVDLDRRAANTVGNALETRKWVRQNAFSSLIVVTSAYHMPRSMAELKHAMPDVQLIPYPVARPTLDLERWYDDGGTVELLLEEYMKYIATRARLALAEQEAGSPAFAGVAR